MFLQLTSQLKVNSICQPDRLRNILCLRTQTTKISLPSQVPKGGNQGMSTGTVTRWKVNCQEQEGQDRQAARQSMGEGSFGSADSQDRTLLSASKRSVGGEKYGKGRQGPAPHERVQCEWNSKHSPGVKQLDNLVQATDLPNHIYDVGRGYLEWVSSLINNLPYYQVSTK